MPDGHIPYETPAFEPLARLDIPYKRYVLPNGLRLLVHEDHKTPVVSVHTWFGVGAKDEPAGRTGFAHLFEHLLFKGSRQWPGSWHNTLEGLGAQGINGTTNQDRTNFFQDIPVGALDMVLAMEANRVENLLDSIDKPTLEAEIKVVLNEKLQREGAPGGRIFETLTETFYPVGHPYAHTVLGSVADVSAANLKTVEEWHSQYYGASNAVMVLAGDIEGDQAFEMVDRWMGGRFAGAPTRFVTEWIPPHMSNRVTLSDHIPYQNLSLMWRAPSLQSDDSLKLHLFAQMLGAGAEAPFRRRFTDNGLLLGVSAHIDARYLAGEFSIGAALPPGMEVERAEALLRETVRDALGGELTSEMLTRRVRHNRFGDLRNLESLSGKASFLATGELFTGDADYIANRINRTTGFTLEEILDTARRWLEPDPFVLRIDPFTARTQVARTLPAPTVMTKPAPARFPEPEKFELANGLKVQMVHRPDTPTVETVLMIPGRLGRETMANAGLPALAMAMQQTGIVGRDLKQLTEYVEDLGAIVGAAAGENHSHISISVPRGSLEAQLRLLYDSLVYPTVPEDELEQFRTQLLTGIKAGLAAPTYEASRQLMLKAYGPDHLANVPGTGTLESLAAFTRDDVLRMQADLVDPTQSHLLIVGDLAGLGVEALVERVWSDLARTSPSAPVPKPDEIRASPGRYAAFSKLGEQTLINGTVARPGRPSTNVAAAAVVNHIVGGAFSSRLNSVLREAKGWTYGIQSQIEPVRDRFAFSVSTSVQADRAVEALDIVEDILDRTAGGPDIRSEELEAAREAIGLTLATRWSTNGQVVGGLMNRIECQIPDDAPRFADHLEAVTLPEIHEAAQAMTDPKAMTWMIGFDPDSAAAEGVARAGVPVLGPEDQP